jgi:flagellar hook-associated protein 3 FlgL
MISRVTEKIKFDLVNSSLFRVQGQYAELIEKASSMKEVNRPSDDPLGTGQILDYRSSLAYIEQCDGNISTARSWLTVTESKLTSVYDILVEIKETALSQGSDTASAETRQIAATSLETLIDELRSLANAKLGDQYLFSGTNTDTEPFSETAGAARADAPVTGSGNAFDGTAATGGSYTGDENRAYVVRIVSGGAFGTATYQLSSDGGKTWGSESTVPGTGVISLGDGLDMTLTAGTADLAAGDLFTVRAYAAGYYSGNGESLSLEMAKGVVLEYGISGEAVFTAQGTSGGTDLFSMLENLRTALEGNDADEVLNQLDSIDSAISSVSRYTAKCGTLSNNLDILEQGNEELDLRITELCSEVEDADMTKLITDYTAKEIALQACYEMSARLGSLTILGYID